MDKAYGLQITEAPTSGLYFLHYLNGRRGAAMSCKPKIADPVTKQPIAVSLDVANKEFDKVANSKLKDGYTPDSSGLAYTSSEDAGRISGYRPTLPADLPVKGTANKIADLLASPAWGLMEKKDGEHRGLICKDGQVVGTNKNGLIVNIPDHWQAFASLGDHTFCGEHMKDGTYAVFDLFDKSLTFSERYAKLEDIFKTSASLPHISLVPLALGEADKRSMRRAIEEANGEGVVYKDLYAPFDEGKNENSLREKFWAEMTCFVMGHNVKRSVSIGATNAATGDVEALGSVTIPENQPFPAVGELMDVRFLYRFEGGSLEQPTSKGVRNDVTPSTVTTDQITRIKYKSQPLDTSGMSARVKRQLAESEFADNMALLKPFLSNEQWTELSNVDALAPETLKHTTIAQELVQRISLMPSTYESDAETAVAQLKYYAPMNDCEWLITKKNKGGPGIQHQAFGSADLGYGPELGYISIAEITENGGLLDTNFLPMTLKDYQTQKNETETVATSSTPEQPHG